MKTTFPFLLVASILAVSTIAQAQMLTEGGACYLETSSVPKNFKIDNLNWEYKNIQITIFEAKSNIKLESYHRMSDTSFLYLKFNEEAICISSGLQALTPKEGKTRFTIRKPDFVNDPDGSRGIVKDTSISNYQYVAQGKWTEFVSKDSIITGNYLDGQRDGEWTIHFIPKMDALKSINLIEAERLPIKGLIVFQKGRKIN